MIAVTFKRSTWPIQSALHWESGMVDPVDAASSFVAGRYLGLIVLRWIFLFLGLVGVAIMLVASV